VEEGFAPVLAGNPDIDALHTVALKRFKKEKSPALLTETIGKLRALGPFDHIIDLQGLLKSALIARLLGRNVHGFDRRSLREGAAAFFYRHGYAVSYNQNVILRGAKLVSRSLGLNIGEAQLLQKHPFLFTDDASRAAVSGYTDGDVPLVLVMVGASWPSKIYPADRMAEAIGKLGRPVLLIWGSEPEKAIAAQIAALTPLATAARPLKLKELIALVEKADLVIGGDTGPVHMAWALNRPSVTIFGPTPSFRNTLQTPINRVLDTSKPIDPSNLDRYDFSIREIDPDRIAELAQTLLKERP
jgi:heptosyltransferase-1